MHNGQSSVSERTFWNSKIKIILTFFLTTLFTECIPTGDTQNKSANKITHDFTSCSPNCAGFIDSGEHKYKYAYESTTSTPGYISTVLQNIREFTIVGFERKENQVLSVTVRDSSSTYDSSYIIKYKNINGIFYSDHISDFSSGLGLKCDKEEYCSPSLIIDNLDFDTTKKTKIFYNGDTLYNYNGYYNGIYVQRVQKMGLIYSMEVTGSTTSYKATLIAKDGLPFGTKEIIAIE